MPARLCGCWSRQPVVAGEEEAVREDCAASHVPSQTLISQRLEIDVPATSVQTIDLFSEDGEYSSPLSSNKSYASCSSFFGTMPSDGTGSPEMLSSKRLISSTQEVMVQPVKRRTRLPEPAEQMPKLNVWALVKDFVGKDLKTLTLPVYINEPLTDLQRRGETFEHVGLLDTAAELPARSLERHMYVAAFALSVYSTIQRTNKPFRDLMNATFELFYPERGFRGLSEKVKHYPIQHAMYGEGAKWRIDAEDEFRIELWLNYVIFNPVADCYVTFHDGEVFNFDQVPTYVHNLIIGNLHVDHRGTVNVKSLATGDTMRCKLAESVFGQMAGKRAHQVKGHLERKGRKVPGVSLSGTWHEALYADVPGRGRGLLWKAPPPHDDHSRFKLSRWACQLNEVWPALAQGLPPTDCRLRTDLRLFEDGYYDRSNDEKSRLEQRQRDNRNEAEAQGAPWEARWFHQVMGPAGRPVWRYKGGYWEARETVDWAGCRDIYGEGAEVTCRAPKAPQAAPEGPPQTGPGLQPEQADPTTPPLVVEGRRSPQRPSRAGSPPTSRPGSTT